MLNKLLHAALLLLITLTCSFGLINPAFAATDSAPANTEAAPSHHIKVYYLHNTFRCFSCNHMGDLTRAAVLGGEIENSKTNKKSVIAPTFQKLVEQNRLSFTAVNIDDKENRHFLKDFHTRAKFPVIVEIKDGKVVRYKVLNEAWTLLHGPEDKFISYIQKNVKDFTKDL